MHQPPLSSPAGQFTASTPILLSQMQFQAFPHFPQRNRSRNVPAGTDRPNTALQGQAVHAKASPETRPEKNCVNGASPSAKLSALPKQSNAPFLQVIICNRLPSRLLKQLQLMVSLICTGRASLLPPTPGASLRRGTAPASPATHAPSSSTAPRQILAQLKVPRLRGNLNCHFSYYTQV